MHNVNNNLPGARVYKEDSLELSIGVEDFTQANTLPKSIWPDILKVLFLGYDVDLIVNNNILDTDQNLLEGDPLVVDLGEFPL